MNTIATALTKHINSPSFKNTNERLLYCYLIACNIDFNFQKHVSTQFNEKFIINFEVNIAGQTVFIELLETPEQAIEIKQQYKRHFTYPIIFCIDAVKPNHVFYEQLVSIFTGLIPLNLVPTLHECIGQHNSAAELNLKV